MISNHECDNYIASPLIIGKNQKKLQNLHLFRYQIYHKLAKNFLEKSNNENKTNRFNITNNEGSDHVVTSQFDVFANHRIRC